MTLLDDILAGIDRILNEPPPSPCGTKQRPHLVHPDVYAGKRSGHCGTCGQRVTNAPRPHFAQPPTEPLTTATSRRKLPT